MRLSSFFEKGMIQSTLFLLSISFVLIYIVWILIKPFIYMVINPILNGYIPAIIYLSICFLLTYGFYKILTHVVGKYFPIQHDILKEPFEH